MQAYRKARMKTHPDRPGGSVEAFVALQKAFKKYEKCPECNNTGYVKVGVGAFVIQVYCPSCWRQRPQ